MSTKKTAKKTTAPKITSLKKGEVYENKHHDLIEVTNGRLKDEGDLGMSFDGRTITFNVETKTANHDKATERFYIDELVRKLTKVEYDEWLEVGCREAEATEPTPATIAPAASQPKGKKGAAKTAGAPKARPEKPVGGKLSALDAAAKVLGEAAAPMTTKAMIEAMAAKGYWTSPGGQTPHATLYSAILREINSKGEAARFTKADRGQFTLVAPKAS